LLGEKQNKIVKKQAKLQRALRDLRAAGEQVEKQHATIRALRTQVAVAEAEAARAAHTDLSEVLIATSCDAFVLRRMRSAMPCD
jgi:hypothetical protein